MSIESSSEVIQNTQNRTMEYVADYIQKAYEANHAVTSTNINDDIFPGFNKKHVGKVRDSFICDDFIVIVTTDRQSAFDRQLASVPFKGQVLNLASYWWFNQTQSFVPNHIIACPHPNVIIGRKCSVFPVEFVMRGYITGTTNTSMWTNYANGVRNYCGHIIPEGLLKNQKLGSNLLTPTTKDDLHDELISAEEVVKSNRMTQEEWDTCSTYAHKLFHFGQMKALERGLILVDTKYEFGKDKDGKIFLIDEIHTPDSSRYWIADTYEQRMSLQQEPENIDKEFLRKWFIQHCNPYEDEILPSAPSELVCELSRRYIMLYELITGEKFSFGEVQNQESVSQAISVSLTQYFSSKL